MDKFTIELTALELHNLDRFLGETTLRGKDAIILVRLQDKIGSQIQQQKNPTPKQSEVTKPTVKEDETDVK